MSNIKNGSLKVIRCQSTGRPRGHWYTSYIDRVCHMLNLTTSKFAQGIIDGKIPRGPLEQWRKQQQQQQQEQKESAAATAAKKLARRMDHLFD
jgi:hypothetical protein